MADDKYRTKIPSALERAEFLEIFGGVYEHSSWIAEQLFNQGLTGMHDNAGGMAAALGEIIETAGRDAQLRLLRTHPDLAGRLALRGELTASSSAEQAGAGLDQCTEAEFEQLQSLNDSYQERFGFPFILAVKGKQPDEIITTFERRVKNELDDEFREALDQVHRIAYLRLQEFD
jgi:2-oxo-4-hydroxy-4-carboxy-5-ureidoimidazoline decarboxylase